MKKYGVLLLVAAAITFQTSAVEKGLVALTGNMFHGAKKSDTNTKLAIAAMLDLLAYDKNTGTLTGEAVAHVGKLEKLFEKTYGTTWDKVDFSGLPIYQKIQMKIAENAGLCESDKTKIEQRLKNAINKAMAQVNEATLAKTALEKNKQDIASALAALSTTHTAFDKALDQYQTTFSDADKTAFDKAAEEYTNASDQVKTIAQATLNIAIDLENKQLAGARDFHKELSEIGSEAAEVAEEK